MSCLNGQPQAFYPSRKGCFSVGHYENCAEKPIVAWEEVTAVKSGYFAKGLHIGYTFRMVQLWECVWRR